MQVLRRTVVALGAVAILLSVNGCGGLGVNIGSGAKGSQNVNRVSLQVQSGANVPTVVRGHTLLMIAIAYYFNGGQYYVSSTQGAIFATPDLFCDDAAIACGDIIRFMDPSCTTELNTTASSTPQTPSPTNLNWVTTVPAQNVCILGVSPGTATLYATVAGVTGTVTVTVQ